MPPAARSSTPPTWAAAAGDAGYGIAVDASGNAYVTGYTKSTDFPTANPLQANCITAATCDNAFVAKLNPAGSALVYSTYLGGSSYDYGYGIAVDGAGNAYVTGNTGRPTSPPPIRSRPAAITVAPTTATPLWPS